MSYKSASKKKGSLNDIISDPNYGVDTRGDFKGTYHMSPNGIITPDQRTEVTQYANNKLQETLESARKIGEIELQAISEYNEKLNELDPRYTGVVPAKGHVIVRLLKKSLVNSLGLWVSDILYKPLKSGLDGAGEPQENPFSFLNAGIVVSSNSEHFEKGFLVQLKSEIIKPIFNKEKWIYEPPYIKFNIFDDVNAEGYVFVREFDIQCTLGIANINETSSEKSSETN